MVTFSRRKIIIGVCLVIFALGPYFFLRINFKLRQDWLSQLNQDTLYLENGTVVRGWIWDDKDGLVIGETPEGKIFTFNKEEYRVIEKDLFLRYLRELI